jgi:hypothetical protein
MIMEPGAQFTVSADIGETMEGAMGIGVRQPVVPQYKADKSTFASIAVNQMVSPIKYVTQARFSYFAGGKESPLFKLDFGSFHFKYNPDTRNLGSYLFRGLIYPGALTSGFEHVSIDPTLSNTVGLGLESNLGGLKLNFILKSETDFRPIFDWTIATLASYNLGGIFELGAGAEFYRALSFRPEIRDANDPEILNLEPEESATDPYSRMYFYVDFLDVDEDMANSFIAANPSEYEALFDAWADSGLIPAGTKHTDFDTLITEWPNPRLSLWRFASTDTTFFSLGGTKLMARFAFDPKPLMGLEEGPDWRIYSEVGVIGVKDYTFIYDDISERIPVMFGINIPTAGILDVLNIEYEYYGNRYSSDTYKAYRRYSPIPMGIDDYELVKEVVYDTTYDGTGAVISLTNPREVIEGTDILFSDHDPYNVTWDNHKWSVYAAKTIRNHIRFSLQVACDHYRPADPFKRHDGDPFNSYRTVSTHANDWYTAFRIGYFF